MNYNHCIAVTNCDNPGNKSKKTSGSEESFFKTV